VTSQFDAGSIIGSLDVDRDPFTEGLDIAKAQAEEFEKTPIRPTVKLQDEETRAELDALQARVAEISDDGINIRADVDDTHAREELDALSARIRELNGREIHIRTDTSQLGELGAAADRAAGKKGDSAGEGGMGMRGLMGVALALAPALYPVAAAAVGFGAAAVGGFAQAGIALGAFALVAKSDFKDMQTATKQLAKAQLEMETATTTQQKAKAVRDLAAAQSKLVGPIGEAAKAYANFQSVWNGVKKDTSGPVFGVMTKALNLVSRLLPEIEPLIVSTAHALSGSIGQLSTALGGPGLGKFLTMIQKDIGPDLKGITTTIINLGGGFAKLLEAINPLTQQLFGNVAGLSKQFNQWATVLEQGGINVFLDYIKQNGPLISQVLRSFGTALVNILEGLAPLTGPALQFLAALGKALGTIDIKPLAKAVGDLLIALIPLLPAIASLANDLLPPLAVVLDALLPVINAFTAGITFLTSGVMGEITTGLILAAGAMWLLNIAMDANPIGLVILAVVALIAIVGEIVMHWRPIAQFFKGLWDSVYHFFKKFGMDVLLILAPFIALPLEVVLHWHQISKFFSDLWDDVTGFFADHWKTILKVLADIILWPVAIVKHWDGITKFFRDLWGKVEKIFQATWNAITHGLKLAWGDIEDFFKKLPGRIVGFFKDAPGWLLDAGKKVIHGLFSGVTTAWNDVVSWFKGLPSTIENWFSDAYHWLINIGTELIQGLWDGIKQKWDDMVNWVKDSAGKVGGVLKKVWNILSPSRVMHEIGTYFTKGLHNGIAEGFVPLLKDVENYAKQITATFDNMGGSTEFSMSGTTQAAIHAQTQVLAINDLANHIKGLRSDLQALPKATGDAVGEKVGKAFDATTAKAVRKATTAARAL
jgi:phage-related protein